MRKVLVGADPELFLQSKTTGEWVSAHDIISGTKDEPCQMGWGAVQVDGVAAEFNIDPADTAEKWMTNIKHTLAALQGMVDYANPDLQLVAQPTVHFPKDYFLGLPESVRRLGCTPDFDAWNGGKPTPTPDSKSRTFRTGGGHVHIGWTEGADVDSEAHKFDCIMATKQLDVGLFLPSLLFDTDRERQMLYGKKGCHRPKVYGVEYRTLSNAWLQAPDLTEWVYQMTTEVMDTLLSDHTSNRLFEIGAFRDALDDWDIMDRKALVKVHDTLVAWGYPTLPERYLEV